MHALKMCVCVKCRYRNVVVFLSVCTLRLIGPSLNTYVVNKSQENEKEEKDVCIHWELGGW